MIWRLVLMAGLSLPLWAHDDAAEHRHPVPEAEVHRPTARPDRIVLTWSGDPATSQAVTWRTDTSVTNAVAQLAKATDKPQASEREVIAETEAFESDLSLAHYHHVEFHGLEPGTLYAYRVGDTVNWSEWFHFRTAEDGPAPFSFVYYGDAQNDIRRHWSRVVREAFREAPRAAFTLHAGDLVNSSRRDAEWGEWFGAPAWVNAMVPVVPTPGNHEYFTRKGSSPEVRVWDVQGLSNVVVTLRRTEEKDAADQVTGIALEVVGIDGQSGRAHLDGQEKFTSADEGFLALTGYALKDLVGQTLSGAPLRDRIAVPPQRSLTPHWRPQFTLPNHGPGGLEETVYYLDYQGARIISLNSNERQEEQVGWLRHVLAHNPNRWTILTFHHPIFSPANKRDNPRLRDLWKPLFDEFRVDLVLTGHDHTYARSGDVSGRAGVVGTENVPEGFQQVYDPDIGTVYVVSVSGPKMYAQGEANWAVRRAEDIQLFQVITVDAHVLRFEARTATGRLYDAFTLQKRPGRANRLIELLPPENRRPAKTEG